MKYNNDSSKLIDIKFTRVRRANVSRVSPLMYVRNIRDKHTLQERHKAGIDIARYCFLDHIATAFAEKKRGRGKDITSSHTVSTSFIRPGLSGISLRAAR